MKSLTFVKQIIFVFPVFVMILFCIEGNAQYPPSYTARMIHGARPDELSRVYLTPTRIVWQSSDSLVENAEHLLEKGSGQAYFGRQPVCKLTNAGNEITGIVLDFGKEIHGGLQITSSQSNRVTRDIRIRFGESVSETFSDAEGSEFGDQSQGATNHHAMRDFRLTLPGYGTIEVGNTGYRFVRIDLLDTDVALVLKEVKAISVFRDVPYLGSFKCNDERLNKIWETAAYTVHLNMQEYLWDGIKRDRMIWAGDMHPEIMAINYVFGYNEVVPKSLDYLRDRTPLPRFMNGISSYSMWWVIMQHDWYWFHGDKAYLEEQKVYLLSLLDQFSGYVDEQGKEQLKNVGFRFLDWPSVKDTLAIHAGLQGLMTLTFMKGAYLCDQLGEREKAASCLDIAQKMQQYVPEHNHSKQAAALLSIAGIMDPGIANDEVIAVGGPENFSTFYGYYMLEAQAKAEDYLGAMENIRDFWGGMLDMGATTFWEDFSLEEAKGAARIDELVPDGSIDFHCSTGANCYIGLRRSLCHGWSAGPAPWLNTHILGIKVLEPGCAKVWINPHLGDLEWAEGTFPTPYGVLHVRHEKQADGTVKTTVEAPDQVTVL
jgi:hypothetical protein